MFPYLEIMFKNKELAWEISDFLELEENEIKRFRPRGIPKSTVEKMEKKKAQMRVEERDRRAEELEALMIKSIEEETVEEAPVEEVPEVEIEEETVEETSEVENEEEDSEDEEKTKKKTDKQVSLFSF